MILIVMMVCNNIGNDGDGEKVQSLLTSKQLYMRSGCGYKLFEQENGYSILIPELFWENGYSILIPELLGKMVIAF